MLESIPDLVTALVAFALGRFSSSRDDEKARIVRVIEKVTSTVESMVRGFESASIAQRQLSQAELREMYERVSGLIPVPVHERYNDRADMLVNMIAAARMYYWLRTFDGEHTLDGLTPDQVRQEISKSGVTRSFASAVKLILTKTLEGAVPTPYAIKDAQTECLYMIGTAKARLMEYT